MLRKFLSTLGVLCSIFLLFGLVLCFFGYSSPALSLRGVFFLIEKKNFLCPGFCDCSLCFLPFFFFFWTIFFFFAIQFDSISFLVGF